MSLTPDHLRRWIKATSEWHFAVEYSGLSHKFTFLKKDNLSVRRNLPLLIDIEVTGLFNPPIKDIMPESVTAANARVYFTNISMCSDTKFLAIDIDLSTFKAGSWVFGGEYTINLDKLAEEMKTIVSNLHSYFGECRDVMA